MDQRCFRAAIADANPHQNILGRSLAIFDEHIKVAIFMESVCVDQLKLGVEFASATIFFDEPGIGVCALRVLVQHLEIRMRWRGIQVIVKLLHVFAVIAFAIGETKNTFLQNGVFSVPEGQRQTEALMIVAEAGNGIFTPTIGAAARLVVTEVIPSSSIGTIILAHGSPLTLAQVGSPEAPSCSPTIGLFQSLLLRHRGCTRLHESSLSWPSKFLTLRARHQPQGRRRVPTSPVRKSLSPVNRVKRSAHRSCSCLAQT